jgi:hypothetical protein
MSRIGFLDTFDSSRAGPSNKLLDSALFSTALALVCELHFQKLEG